MFSTTLWLARLHWSASACLSQLGSRAITGFDSTASLLAYCQARRSRKFPTERVYGELLPRHDHNHARRIKRVRTTVNRLERNVVELIGLLSFCGQFYCQFQRRPHAPRIRFV